MTDNLIVYLPWPPTVNNYYKTNRSGARFLDKSVRKYRAEVNEAIHEQAAGITIDEPVYMEVHLFPPDRRKRDLDNYMKGLLDSLMEAELIEDDSLIDQLCIYRGNIVKQGYVKVEIADAGPLIQK